MTRNLLDADRDVPPTDEASDRIDYGQGTALIHYSGCLKVCHEGLCSLYYMPYLATSPVQ